MIGDMSFRPPDQKAALLSFRAKVRSTEVEKSFGTVMDLSTTLEMTCFEMTRFMFIMFSVFVMFFNVLLCFSVLLCFYVLVFY